MLLTTAAAHIDGHDKIMGLRDVESAVKPCPYLTSSSIMDWKCLNWAWELGRPRRARSPRSQTSLCTWATGKYTKPVASEGCSLRFSCASVYFSGGCFAKSRAKATGKVAGEVNAEHTLTQQLSFYWMPMAVFLIPPYVQGGVLVRVLYPMGTCNEAFYSSSLHALLS